MTTGQDAKLALLKSKHAVAELGGGQDKIDKHHASGRLTARERIAILLDEDSFVRKWTSSSCTAATTSAWRR